MKGFLFILLVVFINYSQTQTCPEQCQCSRLKWTCGGQNINDTVLLEIAHTGDPLTAEELILKVNLITNFPAEAFTKFSKLEIIELGQNLLTKPPANVSDYIPSVHRFSIDQNKISKISRDDFLGYQNIKILDIFSNTLTEIEPNIFENLQNLQKVFAENNQIEMLKNGTLNGAENLLWISFDGNALGKIERDAFAAATKLERLWLSYNKLTSLPEGVFRNQRLVILKMKSNQFTDFPPKTFNSLSVDLTNNSLTTLQKNWFALKPNELYLEQNPLHCDCALFNTMQYFFNGNDKFLIFGNCKTPADLKDDDIYEDLYRTNKLKCTACSLNECQNNSTCKVVDKLDYTCVCSEKNQGRFCQFENACLDNPCQHNGTCLKIVDTFMCNCSSGFLGEKCEIEKPCYFNNPCQNNGTCLRIVDTFMCNCSSGFLGEKCEIEKACYFNNPCQNNGTCQPLDETSDKYQCLCVGGYSGQNCEILGEETKIKIGYIILIILVALALIALLLVILYLRRRTTKKAEITEDTPLKSTQNT
uniref:EGF-like domain-containing protein n=2 Tax=Clytia hemisphaerica TaxID=252671 RepID=A0A7M5UYS4_9CNID